MLPGSLAEQRAYFDNLVIEEAKKHQVFTLGEVWWAIRYINYQRVSKILLKLWREDGVLERLDKAGTWRQGYFFSQAPAREFTHKATYRWK